MEQWEIDFEKWWSHLDKAKTFQGCNYKSTCKFAWMNAIKTRQGVQQEYNMKKVCFKCKEEKELSEFNGTYCKVCDRKYQKAYKQTSKGKARSHAYTISSKGRLAAFKKTYTLGEEKQLMCALAKRLFNLTEKGIINKTEAKNLLENIDKPETQLTIISYRIFHRTTES